MIFLYMCLKYNHLKLLVFPVFSRVSEDSSMPLAGLEPAWFPA